MALVAAVTGAVTLGQTLLPLVGGSGKDKARQDANKAAYERAIQGDQNALQYLLQRSGQNGVQVVPGFEGGQAIGGWAGPQNQEHAKQLYDAARQQLSLQGIVVDALGKVPAVIQGAGGAVGSGVPVQIQDAAKKAAQEVARETGHEIVPQWALWLGVAALGGLLLFSLRK